MIIDCFTFFNEFDVLEIRLHELDPWVDRFVLVESTETFSGNEKPLFFQENKSLFQSFSHKITHLISPKAENPKDAWDRQTSQRDYVIQFLSNFNDGDLVLVGDVDEIPRGRDFSKISRRGKHKVTFIQKNYMFYINLWRPGGWPGTVVLPLGTLKTEYNSSLFKVRMSRRNARMVKRGGWHFANMGGEEAVTLKMKSSGHFNLPLMQKLAKNPAALHDFMEVTRVVKGRKLRKTPIDDDYPKWLRENIDKFTHLIT